ADRALKEIAHLLKEAAGADDRVFRIGGEEFAMLCWHPHALARLHAEGIRHAIKASGATNALPLSISVGVATVAPGADSMASLFALADRRLYAAKSGGRDRVVGENPAEPPARLRQSS